MEAPRSRQIAFDGAFGKTIAAYVGKPAAREGGSANKAMVVHGLDELEGAQELAPNLGIYRGGAAAAAERVRAGTAAARLPVFYRTPASGAPASWPRTSATASTGLPPARAASR